MPYVYILHGSKDKYYIGSTVDLGKRVIHHTGGFTPSSKKLGDLRLVFAQEYKNLSEARSVERKLKRMKRRDYIEKIIKNGRITIEP